MSQARAAESRIETRRRFARNSIFALAARVICNWRECGIRRWHPSEVFRGRLRATVIGEYNVSQRYADVFNGLAVLVRAGEAQR